MKALVVNGIGVAHALTAVVIGLLSGDEVPADPTAGPSLVGPVWSWEGTIGSEGSTVAPADPTAYTISFADDGSVAVRADCNRGFGTYTSDDASVQIDVAGVTRAFCGEDSLGERYLEQLGFVRTYLIVDGTLLLELMADGGSMRHRTG
jgi:heat shock protein HslJ